MHTISLLILIDFYNKHRLIQTVFIIYYKFKLFYLE